MNDFLKDGRLWEWPKNASFKQTHWNLSLTDISSTWLAIIGNAEGASSVFCWGEFGAFEMFTKNDWLAKPDVSYFSIKEHQNEIIFGEKIIMIIIITLQTPFHLNRLLYGNLRSRKYRFYII